MAIATWLEFGEIRGSIGGKVYSRNRYGQYIRNRAVPVNPNSARQQAAKSRFTELTERWSSQLTALQRAAWNDYGAAVPMTNRLGQVINLSGFAHYIRSNTQALQVFGTAIDPGPTVLTLPGVDSSMSAAISEATQLISVTFDNVLDWANEDEAFMQISMSKPVGVGRTYLVGHERFAGAIEGDGTTPPTSPTTMAVPFAVAENQQVIVTARIGRADGRLSSKFHDSLSIAS